MTSQPQEEELQAYIDGHLDAEEMARIEEYLAENPFEHNRIESYRRHRFLLRQALIEGSGPSGVDLRRLITQRQVRGRLLHRPSLTLTKIAAGLVLFLTGAASHFGLQAYDEWRRPAELETATAAHRVFSTDSIRPVEISASHQVEMQRWFEQHLGTRVEVPDLSSLALRLVGGRLLVSPEGPMAQLLYQDRRGDRLTLYLTAHETDVGSEVEVVKVSGLSAGFWQDSGLTYTIIADMEVDALYALAAELSGETDFPHL